MSDSSPSHASVLADLLDILGDVQLSPPSPSLSPIDDFPDIAGIDANILQALLADSPVPLGDTGPSNPLQQAVAHKLAIGGSEVFGVESYPE
jgi:hypothetical protein